MQLEHSFTVPVDIDEAWRILLDIERVGACMPGAAIDSVDGDDFTGTVKVKLGPINLTYKGKASFVEKDEAAHRAVIDARGRDARGNGTAAAKVTATLSGADGSTTVRVNTDLDITGKPAQFGRGVMVDVGNKLIGQFADRLAATIGATPGTDSSGAGGSAGAVESAGAAGSAGAPGGAGAAGAAGAAGGAAGGSGSAAPGAAATASGPAGSAPGAAGAAGAAAAAPTGSAAEGDDPTATADAAQSGSAGGVAPAAPDDGAGPSDDPPPPAVASDSSATAAESPTSAGSEPTPSYAAPGIPAAGPGPTRNGASTMKPQPEVEPIDLLHSAGPAVAKRLAPVALALVLLLGALRRRRRRRG